ncbi:MAG: hypothetical protein PHZ26_05060 [Candidatus Gracilibacteria bacterium]|nr:hypothetical protein [Candidatus Gracilibacteria bacterium]MDD2909087.1 hypothetical protein [Candidatus Gracilibacteria bacterium]
MKRTVILLVLAIFSVAVAGDFSFAATSNVKVPKQEPEQVNESGPERVARLNGFTSCQNVVKKANDVILGDSTYSAYMSWNKSEINNHSFNVQAIKSFSDSNGYVTYSVIPNKNGGCDVITNQILTLDTNCQSAREDIYPDWILQGTPFAGVTYLTRGGIDLFLMSQNNGGCIIVRHEDSIVTE